MTSGVKIETDPNAILACTVCRDVQNFDLLIVDMEDVMGDQWGDLGFEDALTFFDQPAAQSLEFIALAIDDLDEDDPEILKKVVLAAGQRDIRVLLIAEDVTPALLHQLLRMGADEFIPYPPPSGELQEIVETLRNTEKTAPVVAAQTRAVPEPANTAAPDTDASAEAAPSLDKNAPEHNGVVIATHGLAGGVGASTLSTNLAWELATASKKNAPSVCILDLDLQFGSISTYLDLPRRDAVLDLWSDTEAMDDESFGQALQTYENRLNVLTSPTDMIPMDLLSNEDVQLVLDMARRHFDYVVVDLPSTVAQWSEVVLNAAHVYFAVTEMDMRSAQNTMRMKRALQAEDMPFDKLRFVLNRAPKFTDLNGKARVKRMGESLGISLDTQLPDGGKPVTHAGDHGEPLALSAPKNPLRREIAKLARKLAELDKKAARAA